jgi:urocanate hydratase
MVADAQPRVTACRGTTLRCKGWRQEAILRMLENNLEVAEKPNELIIYAGSARAARDWDSYERIVRALRMMDEEQTLVVQSGKPIGLFTTHRLSPIVVMSNGSIVPRSYTPELFQSLVDQGLTIYAGMTAGAWQYIGSQGILQGTYETFMAAARRHFGGTLSGRFVVTAGLGGMGGAQPLAGVLAGAAILIVEADARRLERRLREGYLQHRATDLDGALRLCLGARERGEAISVGLVDNIARVLPELIRRDITPDIVTDQTATGLLTGYIPLGLTPEEVARMQTSDRSTLVQRGQETIAIHMRAMLELGRRGAEIFEYGNGLRAQARDAGVAEAFEMGVFTERYIRPLFCQGIGPFRWIALSGDPADIAAIDDLILEHFAGNPITDWIDKARHHVRFSGLPARIGWLGHGQRTRLGLLVNQAVAEGRISAPVSFTRDHLDSGSVANPQRETEHMQDGSDAIADWPLLNALLNCASHADLVAIHHGASAGVTTVADGTEQAAERLSRVLTNDTGLGVLRYADAGYETAVETAQAAGLGLGE